MDRKEIIRETLSSGVSNFIVAGFNIESSKKAIQIAKNEWGTEDGVSFDIQNREGNIYTVAVRSTSNTQVYVWYRVNVETESIEE